MEEQDGVTIGFTIKGADPNAKLPPDAECGICGRRILEHTKAELHACAVKQREAMAKPQAKR